MDAETPDRTPRFHEVRELPLESIVVNDWNPNTLDGEGFERLVTEMGETGFLDPIQVVPLDDGTYRILGGEHRFHAAKRLGWRRIQAMVLTGAKWLDADLQKFVTVRLNVLHGKLNPTRMAQLYDEMAAKYGDDALAGLMAYTDKDAWKQVLKDIGRGIAKSLPKGMAAQFKDSAPKIKSLDDLTAVLNKLFSEYGSTLDKNFMVFTYGGKEHVFVVLDELAKRSVDALVAHCKSEEIDVNAALGPAIDAWLSEPM